MSLVPQPQPVVAVLAASLPPARGAEPGEVVAASVVAFLAIGLLVLLGVAHRRRRVLDPLVTVVERRTGLPGWSVIPGAVAMASLVVAVFGYYWDVSWHIDRGRDPGAFANPAHWFIIIGLDGIAFAGILALILGDDRAGRSSVRLSERWSVPVGGVLLSICGLVALSGFPLDDIWHGLFGQDVTAWGPTHIQMIGGASLATLAVWVLNVEGERAAADAGRPAKPWLSRARHILSGGSFLIGLSTLQVEFDFGVPQFRTLYHPVLIMLAAGIALVAVRICAGRGAALGAAMMFMAVRGVLSAVIDPVLGRSLQHFPLYVAEALVVEGVALLALRRRPVVFGVLAGLGIGTVGMASEWAWSHAWMPNPWTASLFPEAVVLGLVAAVGGGVLGASLGRALTGSGALVGAGPAYEPLPRFARPLAWLMVVVALAVPLPTVAHKSWTATLAVQPARGARDRAASISARFSPADAPKGAELAQVIAWQGAKTGDGGLVLARLRRGPDGTYRTDRPVPMAGTWKTILRVQRGNSLQAVPIYLPDDPAIPAPGVRATTGQTVAFRSDKSILQREAVGGSVGLQRLAYALLTLVAAAWMMSISWGVRRLERRAEDDPGRPLTVALGGWRDRRRSRPKRPVPAGIS